MDNAGTREKRIRATVAMATNHMDSLARESRSLPMRLAAVKRLTPTGGVNVVDLRVFEFLSPPEAPFIGRSLGNSGLCRSG